MNLLFLLFIILAMSGCKQEMKSSITDGQEDIVQPVDSLKQNADFTIHKGTNIGHWLSQASARQSPREEFFTEADVENIANMGFDHIRLPVDEEQLWDEKGNRLQDGFALMENCIAWCMKNNLRVIVDLHILRSHHFVADSRPLWDSQAEQEKYYALWDDLQRALAKYPMSMVAYELLNEPVAPSADKWNILIANVVEQLRKKEPQRTIVIGSNNMYDPRAFDELEVPQNDKHLILSFHFYDPHMLTHWNTEWTEMKGYTGPVHYPDTIITESEYKQLPPYMQTGIKKYVGQVYNKEWLLSQWQEAIKKAQELGLPLYCSEFGTYFGPPEADLLRWYDDMVALFQENGISYANWNYKSNTFGLITDTGQPREQFIQATLGDNEKDKE